MKVRIPNNGMGGNAQNMQQMIRKMQEDMQQKQEELDNSEYDVAVGGGVVSMKINGKKEVLSVSISPEVVDPDDI